MKRPDVWLRNKKARGNRYKGYKMIVWEGTDGKRVRCWFIIDGQRTKYSAELNRSRRRTL